MKNSDLQKVRPVPDKNLTLEMSEKVAFVKPNNFEIFKACVDNLTGKDKIAKVVLYFVRLLDSVNKIHGLGNPEVARAFKSSYRLDSNNNNKLKTKLNSEISSSLSSSLQIQTSLSEKTGIDFNIFKHASPIYIIPLLSKILAKPYGGIYKAKIHRFLLILLAFITKKLSGLLVSLSIYRHLLVTGYLPFKIWKFSNHIRHSIKLLTDKSKFTSPAVRLHNVLNYWTTIDMITQITDFWYDIAYDLILAFKLKILLHGNEGNNFTNALFAWAEDSELYGWMASILLGLNRDWNNWNLLKDKESKIILNQKVKARTIRIVGDLQRKDKFNDLTKEIADFETDSSVYQVKLDEIHTDMTRIKINSVRLFCDMIFDAKYIFGWNMYIPLHISIGITSGVLGFCNVWRQQRDRLEKEAIAAAISRAELDGL